MNQSKFNSNNLVKKKREKNRLNLEFLLIIIIKLQMVSSVKLVYLCKCQLVYNNNNNIVEIKYI